MDDSTQRWLTGLAVLAGPLLFLLGLAINYPLVPWACAADRPGVLRGGTLVMLLPVVAGGVFAWRAWRQLAAETGTRPRFMAGLGVTVSGLFVLVILAQWFPQLLLNPCVQ